MSKEKISTRRETISNVKPSDINEDYAKKILDFLNTTDATDIASTIVIWKRDIGIKIAEAIVARRAEVGRFKSLDDVMNTPYIG